MSVDTDQHRATSTASPLAGLWPAAPGDNLTLPPVQAGARARCRPYNSAALLAADLVALALSYVGGIAALARLAPQRTGGLAPAHQLLLVPAFLAALALHGTYGHNPQSLLSSGAAGLRAIAQSLASGVLLALAADALLGAHGRALPLSAATSVGLPALVLVPALRAAVSRLASARRPRATRVLLVGSGRIAGSVAARLSRCSDVTVVGAVDDDPHLAPGGGPRLLGPLADLPGLCRAYQVDRVLVTFTRTPAHTMIDALRRLDRQVRVSVVPRLYELLSWRSDVEELHGIPLMHVAPAQLFPLARLAKRAFDVVTAAVALIALAPVLVTIALAVACTSSGPVLFRQERAGRGGQRFRILKFRTMYAGAEALRHELAAVNEADGPVFKLRADPRVTRVGAVLRRTSLDELPQLVNVLRGQMSLVGPRPFTVAEAAGFSGWAARRFDVPPGITGLWQISGRSDLSFDDLRHLDCVYVESWSFWWDLRILWETPRAVLRRRGAY